MAAWVIHLYMVWGPWSLPTPSPMVMPPALRVGGVGAAKSGVYHRGVGWGGTMGPGPYMYI